MQVSEYFGPVDGGYIGVGTRSPGSRVPSVALVDRGKVVWSLEVPATNPLAADKSAPELVGVAGGSVVVAYEVDDVSRLAAFALADGTRRWDQPAGRSLGRSQGAGVGDAVLHCNNMACQAFDAATGAKRFVIP